MIKQTVTMLAVGFLGVAAGAAIVATIGRDDDPPAEPPVAAPGASLTLPADFDASDYSQEQLAEMVESLTITLNAEVRERQRLTEQLQQVQSQVDGLQSRVDEFPDFGARGRENAAQAQARILRVEEMGFSPEDMAKIQNVAASAQLRGVELDDRARREGWFGTQRYQEEMQALQTYNNPVREHLGDRRYDDYQYALGRPNRVVVGSIMEASAAEQAGLQRGDVIVSYAGQPVLSNAELVNLRSAGNAGEPVVVRITRNGQPLQITIPRGPMGFAGNQMSIDPRTNTPK